MRKNGKLPAALLCLLLLCALCLPALAENERTVSYRDADLGILTAGCASIPSSDGNVILTPGWYAVTEDTEIEGKLFLEEGSVFLVLCDGASLTVRRGMVGINERSSYTEAKLTVYAGHAGAGSAVGEGGRLILPRYLPDPSIRPEHPHYDDDFTIDVDELTVHGGTIESKSTPETIHCLGILAGRQLIVKGGVIVSEGANNAIRAGHMTVMGGSVSAESSSNVAIELIDSGVTMVVSGGTVYASSQDHAAIWASGLAVTDGEVTAESTGSCGIECREGLYSFQGGKVDVRGGSQAFQFWTGVSISFDGVAVFEGEDLDPVNAGDRESTCRNAQAVSIRRCEENHESGSKCQYCGLENRTKTAYRRLDGGTGSALCTLVSPGDEKWKTGWYAVKEDVKLSNRVAVEGNVHLILCDGATLTAPKGICVPRTYKSGSQHNSLTIWDQSAATGSLVAEISEENNDLRGFAGIGGENDYLNERVFDCRSGEIVINGGNVTATGGIFAAGIGGGARCVSTDYLPEGGGIGGVTINRGSVMAAGIAGGAGIGGGYMSDNVFLDYDVIFSMIAPNYYQGYYSIITINGGNIEAYGTTKDGIHCVGSAIGGGFKSGGGWIIIRGGEVEAASGNAKGGAAIGSGGTIGTENGNTAIFISGGKIKAVSEAEGAGIGGGSSSKEGVVVIGGGEITAKGGSGVGNSGYLGSGWNVSIRGGSVTAEGGGAGIDGTGGSVEIAGGSVTARGTAAGIDGTGGSIRLRGADVTAAVTGGPAAEPFRLPGSLTEIGNYAFRGDKIGVMEIPEACGSIGYCAFQDAFLKEIHIPAGCEIRENTFSGSKGAIQCDPLTGPAPGG